MVTFSSPIWLLKGWREKATQYRITHCQVKSTHGTLHGWLGRQHGPEGDK